MNAKHLKNEHPKTAEEKRHRELDTEAKTTDEIKETLLSTEEIKESKKYKILLNKNPLLGIFAALEEKHAGSTTERKTMITCLLYTLNALATGGGILKITGSSSAGKSDAAETVLKCFPDDWIKAIDDLSPAAIKYIQWKNEIILYIKEAKDRSTEHLKLMDKGDGGFTAAVTMGSPSEGFRTVEIKIPVKFILTTRAEGSFDQQLENRMFEASVDETEEQTFNVMFIKAIKSAGYGYNTNYKFHAIREFMNELKTFDDIRIPYSFLFAKILKSNSIRARRDFDKAIMLCQTSAFLNQKNRPVKIEKGKEFLYGLPEDCYNLMTLSMESFIETISGLTKKLKSVYDALPSDGGSLTYLDISKKTPVSKKTVQRYCEELDSNGYIETETNSKPYRIKKVENKTIIEATFDEYKIPILLYSMAQIFHDCPTYKIPLSWYDFSQVLEWDTYNDLVGQKKSIKEKNWDNIWDTIRTKIKDFYEKEEIANLLNGKDKLIIKHPCLGLVSISVPTSISEEEGKLYICGTSETVGQKERNININLINFCICPVSGSHKINSEIELLKKTYPDEKVKKAIQITIDHPKDNYDLIENILGEKRTGILIKKGVFTEIFLGTLQYNQRG